MSQTFTNRKLARVVLTDGRTGMLQSITRVMELDGYRIRLPDGSFYCADREEVAHISRMDAEKGAEG